MCVCVFLLTVFRPQCSAYYKIQAVVSVVDCLCVSVSVCVFVSLLIMSVHCAKTVGTDRDVVWGLTRERRLGLGNHC